MKAYRTTCSITALLLACLTLYGGDTNSTASAHTIKIILVGDSTVTDKAGWGAGFRDCLTAGTECVNTAQGGRSSLSFMQEGRWTNALALGGDYYLIQFGHNNEPGKPGRSTDMPTFVSNMKQYVDDARRAGATPVLVTPLSRRQWDKGSPSRIKSSLTPYAEAVQSIAVAKHVPFIDLHARSKALYETLGKERCLEFSPLKIVDGTNTVDNTHLNEKGSIIFGFLVAEELARVVPDLASNIKPVAPVNGGKH